jgi:hypothetical protein
MLMLNVFLLMIAIPVATAIFVSPRLFGIYVVLLAVLAMIAAANPPEQDFSSPLGGFDEALLVMWGLIWAAVVFVKAVFIIYKAGKAGSGPSHPAVWTALLSAVFVMVWWQPDQSWAQSAIILGAAAAVMIVLKAIVDGRRLPRLAASR